MEKSLGSLPSYSPINDKAANGRSNAFDFRSASNVCPTCGGTGKVPKGQQDELVALIPYKDERLKPRRTCLIVVTFLVIIVVMVIIATLLAVFLSPRNVTFTCNKLRMTNWTDIKPLLSEGRTSAYMTLQVHGIVKNNNYISILMQDVNLTLTRNEVMVGHSAVEDFSVNGRQHKEIVIEVNATFAGAEAENVRKSCQTWETVSLETTIVSTYKYLSHKSDTDDMSHFYVSCNNWNNTAT